MRSWLSNLGSALLALALAVTVWVVAVREEFPRGEFSEPIAVSRAGLSEDLSVFGDILSEVRIEIQAPRETLARPPGARFHGLGGYGGPARG